MPRESVAEQGQGFELGSRRVGPEHPCVIIGEVGLAHEGSLGAAHAFLDGIANAGADGVKFQTHIAEAESPPQEPFRLRGSHQDATRYDYWKRTAFTESQWRELAAHARERGLLFLSSPFSVEAVNLLSRVGVHAWKIASGQVTDVPMFEQILETGLPILLSSGMSTLAEIDQAVQSIAAHRRPFLIFQTTSCYPCAPEKIGLNMLSEFRQRYHCSVGFSDHSGTVYAGLAAAMLGIQMLEVHVTLSREMFGADVSSSITLTDLRQVVEGVRFIERLRAHPVDKDALARELEPMRLLFCKSLVARKALSAGTVVEAAHLTTKKPGTGIAANRMHEMIGRRLRRDVAADEMLREEDFERRPEPAGMARPR